MKNNKRGFTLIEVIGVISILALMLLVGFPALTKTLKRNEQKQYDNYIKNLEVVSETYIVNKLKDGIIIDDSYTLTINDLMKEEYVKEITTNPSNGYTLSKDTIIIATRNVDNTFTYDVQEIYELPSTYQQVEYIESTGTQYIDAEVIPTNNTNIIYDFEYLSGQANAYIPLLGQRHTVYKNSFVLFVYSEDGKVGINYASTDTGAINNTNGFGRHTYENKNNKFYLDGNLIYEINNEEFTSSTSITVFGFNIGSSVETRELGGRVYSLKIYEGNTIIRSFVPCYRKSDGVVGLYDVVNMKFYTTNTDEAFDKGKNI